MPSEWAAVVMTHSLQNTSYSNSMAVYDTTLLDDIYIAETINNHSMS